MGASRAVGAALTDHATVLARAKAAVAKIARHIDPGLTLDSAVRELKNRPKTREAVRDAIVDRRQMRSRGPCGAQEPRGRPAR
jgi:hypothetical protein